MGNVGRLAFILGLAASLGAVGCFLSKDESTASSPDEVVAGGDGATALKSTLILVDAKCTAAKVGPKHLLLAARCVAGNPAFETGKVLAFRAATERQTITGDTVTDAGKDSGKDAQASSDSGAKDAGADAAKDAGNSNTNGARQVTIASVEIHSSYGTKCRDNACDFGKIASSDAKDIAVVILENDLETVPTIPVDLDVVGQSDELLAVASGCTKVDGNPAGGAKVVPTIAVPSKSANHDGSPYKAEPQFATRLGAAYVVTPGPGWRPTEGRICKNDVGAPLFRANVAAVAGVTSNFTTWEAGKLTPVTIHHTRVDATSKVGTWLESLGVETTRSCGEAGCVKKEYDGGVPSIPQTDNGGTTEPGDTDAGDAGKKKSDASTDDDAGESEEGKNQPPTDGQEQELPPDPPEDSYGTSDEDYADAAAPKKKKKKAEEGCSASPGQAPSSGMAVIAGLALAAAVVRRRKQKAS